MQRETEGTVQPSGWYQVQYPNAALVYGLALSLWAARRLVSLPKDRRSGFAGVTTARALRRGLSWMSA